VALLGACGQVDAGETASECACAYMHAENSCRYDHDDILLHTGMQHVCCAVP